MLFDQSGEGGLIVMPREPHQQLAIGDGDGRDQCLGGGLSCQFHGFLYTNRVAGRVKRTANFGKISLAEVSALGFQRFPLNFLGLKSVASDLDLVLADVLATTGWSLGKSTVGFLLLDFSLCVVP
jgi:hypothetical protein